MARPFLRPRRAVVLAGVATAIMAAIGIGILSATGAPAAGSSAPVFPPPAIPGWTLTDHQIAVDGRQRDFLVARPVTVRGPTLPVLIVLHGRRMVPAQMARLSGFPSVAGQAIVVYPAGLGDSWNAGACCAPAHTMGADDVRFLADLVRSILSTQPRTAAGSVFLAGYSNGGRMALQMACLRPDLFAAVAAVEAVPAASCNRSAPVPLLMVASTGDPLVNIDGRGPPKVVGGFVEPTVDQVVSEWRARDGCPPSVRTATAGRLTRTTWSGCGAGGEVALDVYAGNRHEWPAGGPTTPSAQAEVWAFFQRHMRSSRP